MNRGLVAIGVTQKFVNIVEISMTAVSATKTTPPMSIVKIV